MENIVLRQQVRNFKRENHRPHIERFDRIFWVWIRCVWSKWKDALIVVKPETVVKWHRIGFRIYWKFISNSSKKRGREKIDRETRNLGEDCVLLPVSDAFLRKKHEFFC